MTRSAAQPVSVAGAPTPDAGANTAAPPYGPTWLAELATALRERNEALMLARRAEQRIAELEVQVQSLKDRLGVFRGVAL